MVEEGTLAELRHLSAHVVEAIYAGAPPAIEPPDGVAMTAVGASGLRFDVHGPVGPLLDRLAGTGVVSLVSREPTLEEIFLARYDRGADDVAVAR
jgi:ABC-2 type transport system ATP-binding protein